MVTKLKKAISYKSKGSKFEQLYNKYSNDINKTLIEMDNISKDNISQKELISLAYQLLGNNEVLKMKFNEDRIREEVGFLLPSTQKRFKDQLKVHFQINCRYTYPDIKMKMAQICKELNINKTFLAQSLSEYIMYQPVITEHINCI